MKAKEKILSAFGAPEKKALLPALTSFLVMLLFQSTVTLLSGASLTLSWMNILRNNVYSGIIALGMSFVILSGGIDISVGSVLCAAGAFLMFLIDPAGGLLAELGLSGPIAYILALAAVLVFGCLLGMLNGLLVSFGNIAPFIVTLGTMKIFRSVTQQLTRSFNPEIPSGFKAIASAKIGGAVLLPILYWVVLTAAADLIFTKTAFGRKVVAIGSNERATRLCGIRVNRLKLLIYGLSGLSCALASVIYVARIGCMDFANAGSGYEMDAIAAVVVGGISMNGGRGRVLGAFIGMLVIGLMNNALNTLGIPTFLCEAVKGAIIILAVLLQRKERR